MYVFEVRWRQGQTTIKQLVTVDRAMLEDLAHDLLPAELRDIDLSNYVVDVEFR